MKNLIVTISLCFCGYYLFAQNTSLESEIRDLEQKEVQAVLNKDTVTLKKIWDKAYVVNNPENRIIVANPNLIDRPVLQNQRASFTREIEKIVINGEVAISMGRETVESTGDQPEAVQRRYTNIWTKKDGSWKLIARHANKICQ